VSWRVHIDELTSKLNKACYVIRLVKPFMLLEVLRIKYFPYVHSVISYGIIWGGGGNSFHCKITFKIQKRIIRVIMGSSSKDSCHELFKNLEVLPFKSQNIFSLSLFVV